MISLFHNPADPVPERLVNFKVWMIKNGIEFSLVTECPVKNPEGVAKMCQGASRIVIYGDDVAISSTISATKSLGIPTGVVPDYVCDIGSSLGLNKLPEEEMFSVAVNGDMAPIDTWVVNGKHMMLSSFCFGAPVDAKKAHGGACCCEHLEHLKQAWKKATPANYRIYFDEDVAEGAFIIVSILNARDVDGVNYVYDSSADDGILEVMTTRAPGVLGKWFGLGFNETIGILKESCIRRAKKVSIECPPKQPCMIDGQVMELDSVEIVAGDKVMIAKRTP